MPHPEHRRADPIRPGRSAPGPAAPGPAAGGAATALRVVPVASSPVLDAPTRLRLGHQLRALYDPVIDEVLDPRLAELLQQLDADRTGSPST